MRFVLVFIVVLATACHHDKPAARPSPVPPRPVAVTPKQAATATPQPVSPNLNASDELARQCALRFGKIEDAPRFDFDAFELLPQDRTILDQIARCVTTGPLRGRRLGLVGRADPRGTDEYNLGLGERRANSVGDYLARLGVARTQLATTTRGDLDAKGTDEASWSRDRRVDIELRN